MSLTQSPHELNPVEEEPDADRHPAIHAVTDQPAEVRKLTWREHLAAGNQAYDQAIGRQKAHGLDAETVNLYEQAGSHFLDATFFSSKRQVDPIELLKLGGSLAWQAKAMKPGIFYNERSSRHVEIKSNLQDIAKKTLKQAAVLMLEDDGSSTETLAGEMTDVNPSEILAEAAVEAAVEAGTEENVIVRGIGKIDGMTPQKLEARGKVAMIRFIGEHATEPKHGPEFMGLMAEEIVEEVTGIHSLPLSA